ncbi:sensor histidine kinase [Anabaena subtropica]|uniref:histidine kinase n=1 Tax=Anabaena subtropica FACHB-260 TaxID=2692884 RepID=A0ABR8CS59_9NOST|nr:ATP-binding protein [Anabaena subtropica]MBD2346027.1 HAMP domain-containing protein [Anabaena subtropica FACHB-260]
MIGIKPSKFRKTVARLIYCSYNWSIARKISYGYAIAISTTLIGTASGSLIAYYYEINAYKQLNLSYEQQYLLKDLENAVSKARLHPQRLVPILNDSIWLELEKNRFLEDIQQINQQISEINSFVKTHPHDLALNYQEYEKLLNGYQSIVIQYSDKIKSFWDKIESINLPLNQLAILLQQKDSTNIDISFEKLSDELILMISHAEIQKNKAKDNFINARKLRLKLISIGILLSTAIAIVVALLTSKLIARPLQTVTNVARKITQESNFKLRANVTSNDEVGTLAKSLNQLVNWVEVYTQELELSRQTLEIRVEERTQELKQAHHTLEIRVEERTQELQKALQELQETQGQLIQTEKMSSLGQMVAGIAHEINNPVNFIYGNIECADNYIQDLLHIINLYQQQYPTPHHIIAETIEEIDFNFVSQDLVNLLSSMKIGAQRIREIVLSLRNFSRLDEADIKEVDIHEGIDNTLLILNHRLKLGIELIKNYGHLPMIECYPAQLNQVFMNIINNAIDALLDHSNNQTSKSLFISTRVEQDYIKVSICDNGPGIPKEIRQKLFDPFFTTKPVGKGTGLGLSISYQIMEKHKGKIELFSELSQGTEFLITLPISTNISHE